MLSKAKYNEFILYIKKNGNNLFILFIYAAEGISLLFFLFIDL